METNKVLAFVREENRKDLDLIRELSPAAWRWAKSYKPGLPGPAPNASQDELMGWRAYIRGYTRRPVFVQEELKKLKREKAQ